MSAPVIYICDGEHSRLIATAVQGAFQAAAVIDYIDYEGFEGWGEVLLSVVERLTAQNIAVLLVLPGHLIQKFVFGQKGLVVYPKKAQTSLNDVLVFDGKTRDEVVEATLRELKRRKILLPFI